MIKYQFDDKHLIYQIEEANILNKIKPELIKAIDDYLPFTSYKQSSEEMFNDFLSKLPLNEFALWIIIDGKEIIAFTTTLMIYDISNTFTCLISNLYFKAGSLMLFKDYGRDIVKDWARDKSAQRIVFYAPYRINPKVYRRLTGFEPKDVYYELSI